jgi:hypothetical protein
VSHLTARDIKAFLALVPDDYVVVLDETGKKDLTLAQRSRKIVDLSEIYDGLLDAKMAATA